MMSNLGNNLLEDYVEMYDSGDLSKRQFQVEITLESNEKLSNLKELLKVLCKNPTKVFLSQTRV